MEEKALEIAVALKSCGFSECESRILSLLISSGSEMTARDLELQGDMRQPRTSWGLLVLEKAKIISYVERKGNMGRPTKYYILNQKIGDIIFELYEKQAQKNLKAKAKIMALEELCL